MCRLTTTTRCSASACLGILLLTVLVSSAQDLESEALERRWGLIVADRGGFIVRGQEPLAPVQPLDTIAPVQPLDTAVQPLDTTIAGLPSATTFAGAEELFQEALEVSTPMAVSSVNTSEARILGANDAGTILQGSDTIQTVNVQHRSPVALDPYIRGYRHEQIAVLADGALWPARRDLDSMISKIDPSLLQDVVVISGPYGLRYGPGFSYINAITADTPRYCNGYEAHSRTGFTYRGNGSQIYGRETVYGGSADWGYIINWGIRKGADYDPGGNAPFATIPSSYGSQNFHAQFGFDLSADTSVEVRYQRVDETKTEFAAQFFDLNFLATDAVSVTIAHQDPYSAVSTRVNAWYNFTRFNGNTDSAIPGFGAWDPTILRKRGAFPVIDRVEYALDDLGGLPQGTTDLYGLTWGDFTSTGIRMSRTYGELDQQHARVGADFRYIEQQLNERYRLTDSTTNQPIPAFGPPFETNMPRADMVDPGVYAEYSVPWRPWLTTAVGGRLDFVHTRARENEVRANSSIIGGQANFPLKNHQNDTLYAFYVSNELLISPVWTATFGAGYGQRVPALLDRYGDGIFLGIIQSGFNRVIGEPNLRKERAWQIDLGADVDCGWWSVGAAAFHAWIDDYNLYQGELTVDPAGARLLRAVNADMVTLFGFEMRGDVNLTDRVIAFGSLRYLEGRDRNIQIANQTGTIDQSLYGIIPMEGRTGLRWIDACGGDYWGLEFGARIVDGQNQVAQLRQGSTVVTGLVPFELTTPGFTTFYVRGYWNASDRLNLVAGIDNLLDRTYIEHLDLRLPAQSTDIFNNPLPPSDPRATFTRVFSPGITPYLGVEYTY